MPDCGVHYLWFAFVCFLIGSHPPTHIVLPSFSFQGVAPPPPQHSFTHKTAPEPPPSPHTRTGSIGNSALPSTDSLQSIGTPSQSTTKCFNPEVPAGTPNSPSRFIPLHGHRRPSAAQVQWPDVRIAPTPTRWPRLPFKGKGKRQLWHLSTIVTAIATIWAPCPAATAADGSKTGEGHKTKTENSKGKRQTAFNVPEGSNSLLGAARCNPSPPCRTVASTLVGKKWG